MPKGKTTAAYQLVRYVRVYSEDFNMQQVCPDEGKN